MGYFLGYVGLTFLFSILRITKSDEKKKNSVLIKIFTIYAHVREVKLYSMA